MFVVVVVEVVLVLGMLVVVGGPALTGGSLGGGKRWKIRSMLARLMGGGGQGGEWKVPRKWKAAD